jgi:hypothetical protein
MLLVLLYFFVPLLACIAGLTAVFFCYRRFPILRDAINMKRTYWMALFISCSVAAIIPLVVIGLDHLSNYLPRGPLSLRAGAFDGVIVFILVPLGAIAMFCASFSVLWCLFRLIQALLFHIRSIRLKHL